MTIPQPEVLIFTPTPNEYKAIKTHVEQASFRNFHAVTLESGPGKINAAFKIAAEIIPRLNAGQTPALVMGVGTSGSLDGRLASGEVIASNSAVITDWIMEDGGEPHLGPYGQFVYRLLDSSLLDEMSISCDLPLVAKIMKELENNGFKCGRLATADTFVAGLANKLKKGHDFKALACDMESGAFAYAAGQILGLPWLNLRVVADTLDEKLADYFDKELDMVDILGKKTVQALIMIDDLL